MSHDNVTAAKLGGTPYVRFHFALVENLVVAAKNSNFAILIVVQAKPEHCLCKLLPHSHTFNLGKWYNSIV